MMKLMRNTIVMGLALAMALVVLAGCSKSSGKYEVPVNNSPQYFCKLVQPV